MTGSPADDDYATLADHWEGWEAEEPTAAMAAHAEDPAPRQEDAELIQPCCGGCREHKYRCPHRVWPATATAEVRRSAVRGDCIAAVHADIEDADMGGKDYRQRKHLTEILARVWDDGFTYAQQIARTPALVRDPSYDKS